MKKISPHALKLSYYLKSGDGVVISQGTGEPMTLTEALVAQQGDVDNISVFLGSSLFSSTFTPTQCDGLRLSGYGGAGTHRALLKAGMLDYYPVHVSQLPEYFGSTIPCDVAMIQVGPRRPDGTYSYSLAGDYPPAAVNVARVVLAESNARAPDTFCDQYLHEDQITAIVETDRVLPQVAAAIPSKLESDIARHLANYIPDRATLQIGGGAIPEALIAMLRDRQNLGVHTGVIGDSIVDLIEKGIITNTHKEVDAGISVTGCLWGTDRLYSFVHQNPIVRLSQLSHTHAPEVLSKLSRLISINSALEVDITGQVGAESLGKNHLGAVGGQIDYVRAGARSSHGASIIALPSTARNCSISRIVNRLSGPVTTARAEVDVVATENGAVRLRGRSVRERVKLMISIAHEKFRGELEREGREMGYL